MLAGHRTVRGRLYFRLDFPHKVKSVKKKSTDRKVSVTLFGGRQESWRRIRQPGGVLEIVAILEIVLISSLDFGAQAQQPARSV